MMKGNQNLNFEDKNLSNLLTKQTQFSLSKFQRLGNYPAYSGICKNYNKNGYYLECCFIKDSKVVNQALDTRF